MPLLERRSVAKNQPPHRGGCWVNGVTLYTLNHFGLERKRSQRWKTSRAGTHKRKTMQFPTHGNAAEHGWESQSCNKTQTHPNSSTDYVIYKRMSWIASLHQRPCPRGITMGVRRAQLLPNDTIAAPGVREKHTHPMITICEKKTPCLSQIMQASVQKKWHWPCLNKVQQHVKSPMVVL